MKYDPPKNCPKCPRLVGLRAKSQNDNPDWHNAPVDTWVCEEGDDAVRFLVVGMAPGIKGANRTGRPFTGDYAGELLYSTLLKYGFAEGNYGATPVDSLKLRQCAITNAVRCVPPQNKPIGEEVNNCRPYLLATLDRFPNLTAMITLGKIAHDTLTRTMNERVAEHPFMHNGQTKLGKYAVFSSYHCSRYNTNTGRLTTRMFEDVFDEITAYIKA